MFTPSSVLLFPPAFADTRPRSDRAQRGACAGGRDRSSPACLRQFLITGHFEHLLQTDGPLGDSAGAAEDPRFWYAPFLDTDLVTPSKMDFAQLPAFNATDDSRAPAPSFLFAR